MRRPVRWIVGIAVGVLLLAGVGYWNALRVAEETLEAGRREFRAEVARLRARNFGRPPLLLPVESGDASEIYAQVLASLDASSQGDFLAVYGEAHDGPTPASTGSATEAATRLTPILLRLEASFHRAYAAAPPAEFGSTVGTQRSERCARLGEYADPALACAKISVREGRVAEALRLLTAAWLVAADTARGGAFADVSEIHYRTTSAREALCDVLANQPLTPPLLRELAGRLDALARGRYRTSESWTIERCNLLGTLAEDPIWADWDRRIFGLPAARENIWSTRIARAHVLRSMSTLPSVLADEGSDPWRAELEPALELVGQDIPRIAHAALRYRWRLPFYVEQEGLAAEAALRLAVAVARFEAERGTWPVAENDLVPSFLPAIPTSAFDPAGLRFSGNKVWSRDSNGVDDGGRRPSDVLGSNGDIVVEVKGHR